MTKPDPFRWFKSSREVVRTAAILHARFVLSLRDVEDLVQERGVDVSHAPFAVHAKFAEIQRRPSGDWFERCQKNFC